MSGKLTPLISPGGFVGSSTASTVGGLTAQFSGGTLIPSDLSVTLDFGGGSVATFAGSSAVDIGDYVGEFVRQKCYVCTNASFPDWTVFFRVDADTGGTRIVESSTGWRDEVIVEYGRTTHGTAADSFSRTLSGFGNGALNNFSILTQQTGEVWTITFVSGTTWTVTGSTKGPQANATTSVAYNNGFIGFTLAGTYLAGAQAVITINFTYIATITKSGVTKATYPVYKHWWYARWRYQSAARPVVRTPATLKSRNWIPNYGPDGTYGVTARTNAVVWPGPMGTVTDPLHGAFDRTMAAAGRHDQIGYITEYAANYVLYGNASCLTSVLTEGEWTSIWTMHARDDTTHGPLNVRGQNLNWKTNGGTINKISQPTGWETTNTNYVNMEVNHMYACHVMPWLLTDDPFFLEAMQFVGQFHILWSSYHRAIQGLPGMVYPGETRGYAWGLRDIFNLANLTPSTVPQWLQPRSYWKGCLDDNKTYAMRFVNQTARVCSLFRTWTRMDMNESWMTAFLTGAVGNGVAQGATDWAPVFEWAIDEFIQYTNNTSGWSRQWPIPYLVVPDKNPATYSTGLADPRSPPSDTTVATSWPDLWAYYISGSSGHTDGNGHTIDTTGWDGHTIMQKYYQTGNEFFMQLRQVISIAANYGTPGVQPIYTWLQNEMVTDVMPYYALPGYANWSIDPLPTSTLLANLATNTSRRLATIYEGDSASPWNNMSINRSDDSGYCYDAARKRIMFFGGGHGPCQYTNIRVFDLQTLVWFNLYTTTPYAEMTLANIDLPYGRYITTNHPTARHTYNMTKVTNNKFYMMTPQGMPDHVNDLVGNTNGWGGRICWYDINTGAWSFSQISHAGTPWDYLNACAVDPVSGNILVSGQGASASFGGVYLYNTVADTAQKLMNIPFGQPSGLVYFPPNDKFYAFQTQTGGEVWEITYNRSVPTSSTFTKLTVTGSPPSASIDTLENRDGFAYNPNKHNIGGCMQQGVFYEFDPPSRVWTATTTLLETGETILPSEICHCLIFDPDSGCYIFLHPTDPNPGYPNLRPNIPIWAYRPA